MSMDHLILSNEQILNRITLLQQNKLLEAIKNLIYTGVCIVGIVFLAEEEIFLVGFIFFAVFFVLKAIYTLLSQEREELIVTNFRIFKEKSNRIQTLALRDYHYEFFESTEVHFHETKVQRIIKEVLISILGLSILITGLALEDEMIIIGGGIFTGVGLIMVIFKFLSMTAIQLKIVLTSGEILTIDLNPREHTTDTIYSVYATIIQNSRRFIENR
jgi:hypothetical protein